MNHLPLILINCVPQRMQRYNTQGDWFSLHGVLHIAVSRMDEDEEFLTMIHELVEWFLCQKAGIPAGAVDDWDLKHQDEDDPGSNPQCVYHKQHMAALRVERLLERVLNDY